MSYDLYAFPLRSGEDAAAAFERFTDDQESDHVPEWTPDRIARAERLASAVQAANLSLQRFAFDYAELARQFGVSELEARERWRDIEFNTPEDDEVAMQITLGADSAALTIPFWFEGNAAKAVMNEALRLLGVIQAETGWVIYDPQLDRGLDPSKDNKDGVSILSKAARQLRKLR